jgi:hypothetical protein
MMPEHLSNRILRGCLLFFRKRLRKTVAISKRDKQLELFQPVAPTPEPSKYGISCGINAMASTTPAKFPTTFRRRHARSKTGCLTCRQRKKKVRTSEEPPGPTLVSRILFLLFLTLVADGITHQSVMRTGRCASAAHKPDSRALGRQKRTQLAGNKIPEVVPHKAVIAPGW